MKIYHYLPVLFFFISTSLFAQNPYISEINYLGNADMNVCDNTQNNYCKGFEITGMHNTDLSDYTARIYDCNGNLITNGILPLVGVIQGKYGIGSNGSLWYDVAQLDDNGGRMELYDSANESDEPIDVVSYGTLCDSEGNPLDEPTVAGIQTNANCSLQSIDVAGTQIWGGSLMSPTPFAASPNELNDAPQTCQNTALAVDLINFSIARLTNKILLRWSTVSEFNSSHFIVEKSNDGQYFTAIAEVSSANKAAQYEYIDSKVITGRTYYRLTSVDESGVGTTTEIRSIEIGNSNVELTVFPNPATQELTILIPQTSTTSTMVELYDAVGMLIRREKVDVPSTVLNLAVADLESGTYFVRLLNGSAIMTQRFLKQ